MRARLSRPMETERCFRIGERIVGGSLGRGGISWRARRGDMGAGGSGVGIERYHGLESSEVSVDAGGGGVGETSVRGSCVICAEASGGDCLRKGEEE